MVVSNLVLHHLQIILLHFCYIQYFAGKLLLLKFTSRNPGNFHNFTAAGKNQGIYQNCGNWRNNNRWENWPSSIIFVLSSATMYFVHGLTGYMLSSNSNRSSSCCCSIVCCNSLLSSWGSERQSSAGGSDVLCPRSRWLHADRCHVGTHVADSCVPVSWRCSRPACLRYDTVRRRRHAPCVRHVERQRRCDNIWVVPGVDTEWHRRQQWSRQLYSTRIRFAVIYWCLVVKHS